MSVDKVPSMEAESEDQLCRVCSLPGGESCVLCDACRAPYHLECAGVEDPVLNRDWFCQPCLAKTAAPTSSSPIDHRNEAMREISRLFEDMKACMEQRSDVPRRSRTLNICYSCNGPETSEMIACEKCDRRAHFICLPTEPPSAERNAWLCVFCKLEKMEAAKPIDALLARLEAMERKMESQMMASAPRASLGPASSTTWGQTSSEGSHELTRVQRSARQAITGKLPNFSGNPEEWSNFISNYEETTRLCGYTDGENVLRLQLALKGKALRAVQCRLRRVNNLPEVMETLKSMFGRPEIVINTLLEQVRRTPPPRTDNLQSLVDYGVEVEEICATVRMSCSENRFDGPLLQELVSRLPGMVKLLWGLDCVGKPVATLADFGKWIRNIKEAALLVTPPSSKRDDKKTMKQVSVHTPVSPTQPSTTTCACDDRCRQLDCCEVFLQMPAADRWKHVRKYHFCSGCLRRHRNECRDKRSCGKNGCDLKHHPLLHEKPPMTEAENSKYTSNLSHSTGSQPDVLLRYVPVTLHGRDKSVNTLALLDEGSTVTLMEHRLMKELGLEGATKPLCLSWTGGQVREENDSVQTNLYISGTRASDHRYEISAVRTVRSLGLPPQTVSAEELAERFKHLNALPIPSFKSAVPRILIGIDNYHLTRPLKTVEGLSNEPVATKTRLGWVASGCCRLDAHGVDERVFTHGISVCECQNIEDRVDAALKGSFGLEDVRSSNAKAFLSKENERALDILNNHTHKIGERYETRLLWRYDDVHMPNNRPMALKRLECLERRMKKEPQLRETINEKIEDYLRKGYIRELSAEEKMSEHPRTWYLPIFPVVNPNKPGKVRIVWDAAASFHGVSLNSMLLTGPDLLAPLPNVLQKFREYRIAVSADIREMYHQVYVNNEDQNSQRFLWRWSDTQREPNEYIMLRMTFGAACSPSCAQFVKNRNADQFINTHPRAVDCIKNEHYVDDMLTSTESTAETIEIARDVTRIHAEGGFLLHNWLSNSPEVLRNVGGEEFGQKDLNIAATPSTQKVLGMWWDTSTDTFRFKIPARRQEILQDGVKPTKRQLLQVLMTIYDPLGLIAGMLLYLKVLLQEVWKSGAGWDDPIPHEQELKWKQWLTCLPQLEKVSIPRCYRRSLPLDGCVLQLHVFVDAGKDGFAAVAYFRYERQGIIEVALVSAKTRVAPLQYVSVPRLELQSAVLGARLATAIANAHRQQIHQRFFWTDSRDVICWINSDHRRYSTFVAHRVGEIMETTDNKEWSWISTKFNVADEGTKWSQLHRHLSSSRWFEGPDFLNRPTAEWPSEKLDSNETIEEERKCVNVHFKHTPLVDPARFSRWTRMQRAIAYVWRFINNARSPTARQKGPLAQSELQAAEITILRELQQQSFVEEYHILRESRDNPNHAIHLNRQSILFKRSPYMDEKGLLRVKGRIDACCFAGDSVKRPIILPKSAVVTDLIVDDYHRRYRHLNHSIVINEVRQKYEIPGLRATCRRIRNKCQLCRVRNATPIQPLMGDLPISRLSAFTRPFTFTGIDYFGPFTVVNGRKSEKRWGVLFTCLTVRAVHIEVAHSLSTGSCLLALRNFIARRGTPNEILSDRGTNFVGASRELREALKEVNINQVAEEANLTGTKWNFNPPAAPHFGGAWERLVRSIKRSLDFVRFTRYPTDAILQSWLIEVENIINCRPLTDVPVDREEDAPLTPNHFLLGSSSGAKPIVHFDATIGTLKNSWHMSQYYADVFWRKWVSTYLPTLTKRTKWFQRTEPLCEGDLVLLIDENLPRGCWPKGRVVKTLKSKDGEVRRAHVQTVSGKIMERPVVKLAVINVGPIRSDSTDENTAGEC